MVIKIDHYSKKYEKSGLLIYLISQVTNGFVNYYYIDIMNDESIEQLANFTFIYTVSQ